MPHRTRFTILKGIVVTVLIAGETFYLVLARYAHIAQNPLSSECAIENRRRFGWRGHYG